MDAGHAAGQVDEHGSAGAGRRLPAAQDAHQPAGRTQIAPAAATDPLHTQPRLVAGHDVAREVAAVERGVEAGERRRMAGGGLQRLEQPAHPTAVVVAAGTGLPADAGQAALVAALRAGRIAGAGLDVFEGEPALHPGYLALDNVVLTPHIGSASRATRVRMAMTAAENLLAALSGARPPNWVNPQ